MEETRTDHEIHPQVLTSTNLSSSNSGGTASRDFDTLHSNSSLDSETSFWRRQVSRLPGNIRPTFTNSNTSETVDSFMPKFIIGAQHSFARPLRSLLSPNSTRANSNTNTKKDQRQTRVKSRDAFAIETQDAWGEIDEVISSKDQLKETSSSSSSSSISDPAPLDSSSSSLSQPDPLTSSTLRKEGDTENKSTTLSEAIPKKQVEKEENEEKSMSHVQGLTLELSTADVKKTKLKTHEKKKEHKKETKEQAEKHKHTNHDDREEEEEDEEMVMIEKEDTTQSVSPTTAKRIAKLINVLESGTIDLAQLKKECWKGIPNHLRPICWQLLIGYLPCSADRRSLVLAKKRKEYMDALQQYWVHGPTEKTIAHQIHIDILRTLPLPMYSHARIQHSLERILYCWAMQHPACGYVQGINDLLTPFFTVYLGPILDDHKEIDSIPEEDLLNVEADAFWCLTKLIDGIQDNYTTAQPGIQRLVSRLREVVQRVKPKLFDHFKQENVEYIQFAFRWMNCLLMREVSHFSTIRMWDTYLAEGADFSEFHLYVCAAFLAFWEQPLLSKTFPDILIFLQNPPTKGWTDKDVEAILSQGYVFKEMFESTNHLSK